MLSPTAQSGSLFLAGWRGVVFFVLLLVGPAIAGTVTGTATFANGAGPATGELRLTVANANPVGVTADPVTLTIASTLRDGVLVSESSGEGQGFNLKASSRVPVLEGEGFAISLAPDAPMTSQVELHGRAEQLWALFGPDGQSLSGVLDANLRATGTMARPALEGAITVADGAYEHGDTGLALRDISVHGAFDQNSARITDVKANDGRGGTLTAQGEITWNGSVHGGVTFNASLALKDAANAGFGAAFWEDPNDHEFICPGAMRRVSHSMLKRRASSVAEVGTRHASRALSQVSQAAVPPLPSGRSAKPGISWA